MLSYEDQEWYQHSSPLHFLSFLMTQKEAKAAAHRGLGPPQYLIKRNRYFQRASPSTYDQTDPLNTPLSCPLRGTSNLACTLNLHIHNSIGLIRELMTLFYWCMKLNWTHMALIHKVLCTTRLLQQYKSTYLTCYISGIALEFISLQKFKVNTLLHTFDGVY